jgi:type IV pilus assembly protein PilO
MKKFSEIPFLVRLGIMLGLAAVVVGGGEYFYLGDMRTANDTLTAEVAKLEADNAKVAPIEAQFKQIKVQNEQLEQQLANLRSIIPEEKDADTFIRMVQEAGVQSGVSIRSFVAKPNVQREFYAEMPFDLALDGTYYGVMQFFDRLAKMSRIANVTNLAMGVAGKGGVRGVTRPYKYDPNETVVASCTATAFYGREQAPPAAKKK